MASTASTRIEELLVEHAACNSVDEAKWLLKSGRAYRDPNNQLRVQGTAIAITLDTAAELEEAEQKAEAMADAHHHNAAVAEVEVAVQDAASLSPLDEPEQRTQDASSS